MKYEITYDTQTILPIDYKTSKVIEDGRQYIIEEKVYKIIEHSCEYFGSSFEGRKSGTKALLGITHKAPIIIEETRKIIFFPTKSPDCEECIWINLNQIDDYYEIAKGTSAIKFKNKDVLEIDMSIGSLTNQVMRATRLKFVLEERTNKIKKDI